MVGGAARRRCLWRSAWTRSARSCRVGLSYRRAGRMVGISKTEVGDSVALLLGEIAALGVCQPDGTFVTSLADLRQRLAEMAATGEAVCVDGLATRVQRPRSWTNQKVLYDAKRHTHTAQGLAVTTVDGDLLWCDGGWPGSCHEHELLELSGWARCWMPPCRHPGRPGLSRHGQGPPALARAGRGRRTKDQRTDAERAHNRCQAGLRALVEQSIGHLAGAWSLRRWRACWFGCATSTGPQPRSSAWPAGSTVSHEEHHGHPHSSMAPPTARR